MGKPVAHKMWNLITAVAVLLLCVAVPPAYADEIEAKTYRLQFDIIFKQEATSDDYRKVTFRAYDETAQQYLTFEYSDKQSGYLITGYAVSIDEATLLTPYHGNITFAQIPDGKYSFENVSVPENFKRLEKKFCVTVSDGIASVKVESSEAESEISVAEDGFMNFAVVFSNSTDLPNCASLRGYVYHFLYLYGGKIFGGILGVLIGLLISR